ncbi:ABC-2 type transport system ATP-binding protein [Microbacterium trichothecenolyticum]|uniref:ABC-2 type transport system ATP-binding protein n=2 Tax=Microbacterium trichothecenolyticum TaxID=69370 RepID=A0ABU0TUL8_MICTR|nr:ABC-2 type transport system ATP-binding protein [Microbacterium trichothecenolyticum]
MDLTSEARKVRQLIGYVPQVGTLQAESVVGEELVFQGRLFGMSRASAEHRGREVLALMGAEEFWGRRAGRLSGGERRKVDIAMGMMNQPDIAFLDEPTVGLDPDARQEMWAMIRNMREKWGTTVVITTHYLDEAEDLADDILMMEGGRLIAHDSTQRLKERFAVDEVFVHLDATDVAETAWSHSGVDGVLSAEYSGTDAGMLLSLRISDGERTLPAVLEVLHRRGQIPMRISVRRGGLQDAFFSLTGKDLLA